MSKKIDSKNTAGGLEVWDLPGYRGRVVFTENSDTVFREQSEIAPITIDDGLKIMPWGSDNVMPYKILDLIEKDETMTTCLQFSAEALYGSGLSWVVGESISPAQIKELREFNLCNPVSSVVMGACQDMKYYAFFVVVLILNKKRTRIVRIVRKEACYCRFEVAEENGRIRSVVYADWRNSGARRHEVIPLLDSDAPLADLRERIEAINNGSASVRERENYKYALAVKIPTVDNPYYPIPHYGALFRGNWYNIKRLIGVAKESKLKNTAPIKYHIQINSRYWENLFREEGITNRSEQRKRVAREKENIIKFLTGAENSGKALFSTSYVDPRGVEQQDVRITLISTDKEGGDWATDIQEAVNMICFTLRVHSNLVGSVPGKSQSNNSGSDKRELYTITQAMQKPYRDLILYPFELIAVFNAWNNVIPRIPLVQLTTLDEHSDAKLTTTE